MPDPLEEIAQVLSEMRLDCQSVEWHVDGGELPSALQVAQALEVAAAELVSHLRALSGAATGTRR